VGGAEGTNRSRRAAIELVEVAYARAPDDQSWADRVVAAARCLPPFNETTSLQIVEYTPALTSVHLPVATAPWFTSELREGLERHLLEILELDVALFHAYFSPPSLVATNREIDATLSPDSLACIRGIRRNLGITEGLAMVLQPSPGVAIAVVAQQDEGFRLGRSQRTTLTRAAIHLETAFRLRRRPEVVRAVLDVDGTIRDRLGGLRSPTALAEQARRIERARTNRSKTGEGGLALWTALVEGELSLVERTVGARREYLVVENAPERCPMKALSPAELDVLGLASRGLSSKFVAYSLGISEVTVSERLASTASKLGVATRIELVRLAAILTRDPRAALPDAGLTRAEKEVLALVARGFTNAQIATTRGRSIHTIANQVARLLQKTARPSRAALALGTRVAEPIRSRPDS
jgi:DNA-binding NarL/FixJ family response regulator